MSEVSRPAQYMSPFAWIRMQPTEGSSLAPVIASPRTAYISPFRAFFFSGRFRVSVSTRPICR
jgi:hypothetical protein